MNMLWLLRMRKWAQHPPSPKTRKLIAIVAVVSFLIFGYEQLFGWPEWLTVNRGRR